MVKPASLTSLIFTAVSPNEFGWFGDLVANTPSRFFPPSLGGRTVTDQPEDLLKHQITQRCEYDSNQRRMPSFRYSGFRMIVPGREAAMVP